MKLFFWKLAVDTQAWEDVFSGWSDDLTGFFKSIASSFICPLATVILLIVALIQLIRLVKLHREGHGEDMTSKIVAFIITVVVTILVGTFSVWGFGLIG